MEQLIEWIAWSVENINTLGLIIFTIILRLLPSKTNAKNKKRIEEIKKEIEKLSRS